MKPKSDDFWDSAVAYCVLVVAVVAIFISINAVMSYFEARAYERVTGKKVSTWDAMFLDLRVQESTKE